MFHTISIETIWNTTNPLISQRKKKFEGVLFRAGLRTGETSSITKSGCRGADNVAAVR